jgi:colanic acid biosynthesis glycosyl transferase WcaI
MRRKRILIHSIVFSPDSVSTAYIYNDIALGFKEVNYEVIILTTTPHYNIVETSILKQPLIKKLFGLYFESDFHGIRVVHVPMKKYKMTLVRVLSFIYWHIFSLIIGISIKKVDFILSPSPPLSIGFISSLISKIRGAKFVYNVQEIYPDLLINQGNLKSNIVIKILRWLEKYIYKNAAAIITIDNHFYNTIKCRIEDIDKLKVVSNFVDTNLYKPKFGNLQLPSIFENDPNRIKVLYAGNIGFYQDWGPVIYAAEKLQDANIDFWIIGEGVQKDYLNDIISNNGLNNIKLLPYQDRLLMPSINSFADIHFISINPQMEQEGFPSKVYTIMACSKPMIVITGIHTPIYDYLKDLNCSILISDNRNEKFLNAINELAKDKNRRIELGKNGYNVIQDQYTKEKVIKKYIDIFESL